MEATPDKRQLSLKFNRLDQIAARGLMSVTLDLLVNHAMPNGLYLECKTQRKQRYAALQLPEGVMPTFSAIRQKSGLYRADAYLPNSTTGNRQMNRAAYEITPPPEGQQGGLIKVTGLGRDFWPDPNTTIKRKAMFSDVQLKPSAGMNELAKTIVALSEGKKMVVDWNWRTS